MTYKRSLIISLFVPLAVVLACFVWLVIFLFQAWKEKDPPVMGGTD